MPRDDAEILLRALYQRIETLPRHDYLFAKGNLPENGLYLFHEDGERYWIGDRVTDRIVRVGTHDEDGRLPGRIRNHYRGSGNNSIFRRHIGSAIINQHPELNVDMADWRQSKEPSDPRVEALINEMLRAHFAFRCIPIQNRSERLRLEEKLIATLAQSDQRPSPQWLGRSADSASIATSGLWNIEHVCSKDGLTQEDIMIIKKAI